jgi:hypothetical protein
MTRKKKNKTVKKDKKKVINDVKTNSGLGWECDNAENYDRFAYLRSY